VALGEFMDDLDVGSIVMETIGMAPNEATSTDEKVGDERLGSSGLFESFGATLLLASCLFVLALLIVILVIVIFKRMKSSPKCQARV